MKDESGVRSELGGLSQQQRIDLAVALLARENRWSSGKKALRGAYPSAPDEMIATASHHVYQDGTQAALDWLAAAELFLRGEATDIEMGPTYHLLYHLYNWLQFREILPEGRAGLLEVLQEVQEFIAEEDWDAVKRSVADLEERLTGSQMHPDFGL